MGKEILCHVSPDNMASRSLIKVKDELISNYHWIIINDDDDDDHLLWLKGNETFSRANGIHLGATRSFHKWRLIGISEVV